MSQQAEEAVDPRGHCYAAVIENRAKEVGIAVLELSRLTLHVTQVSKRVCTAVLSADHTADASAMNVATHVASGCWQNPQQFGVSTPLLNCQFVVQFIEPGRSYTTTQLLLDAYQPTQLVVVGSTHHEVAGAAGVNQVTAQAWEQVPLVRSAFDDTKGILAVQELTGWNEQSSSSGLQDGMPAAANRPLHQSHYLGFGAAGALLSHVRRNLGIILAPKTLQVSTLKLGMLVAATGDKHQSGSPLLLHVEPKADLLVGSPMA